MTITEIKEEIEKMEEFESIIDEMLNFKKYIKHFETISIEGSWTSKKDDRDWKAEIVTTGIDEIKLIKPFIKEYEKYLLNIYNSKIEKLQKAGIEIESKYKKEKIKEEKFEE